MPIVHMSPTDSVPTEDGQVAYYSGAKYRLFPMRPRSRDPVIYVPGVSTEPFQHRISCQFLSALTDGEVIGVYNLTQGLGQDLGQCIVDKFAKNIPAPSEHQWTSPVWRLANAREYVNYNPAVVGLIELLVDLVPIDGRSDPVHIVCHSQGCLIVNLAVRGFMWVRDRIVGPIHVFALASPVHEWLEAPGSLRIWRMSYSQDPIAPLSASERYRPILGSPAAHVETARRDPTGRAGSLPPDVGLNVPLRVHNPDMNLFMRNFVQELRADLGLNMLPDLELYRMQQYMHRGMYQASPTRGI
jgi:hypothetical protein